MYCFASSSKLMAIDFRLLFDGDFNLSISIMYHRPFASTFPIVVLHLVICCNLNGILDAKDSFSPDQSTLPVRPPKDAVVLLDGSTNRFVSMEGKPIDWPAEDGVITSKNNGERANHIVSTFHFRDAQIHVEFVVDSKGDGNSGIYIHGHYELQILDSYRKKSEPLTQHDEGALYGFQKPLANAARPAGEWQVYDILYRAPRRNDAGHIVQEGSITAWLNGTKVQDETRFGEPRSVYHPFRYGTTEYLKSIVPQLKSEQIGPVFLQDHDSPTKFRNVWIVPLDGHSREYVYKE
jgi:hypothetical protein